MHICHGKLKHIHPLLGGAYPYGYGEHSGRGLSISILRRIMSVAERSISAIEIEAYPYPLLGGAYPWLW